MNLWHNLSRYQHRGYTVEDRHYSYWEFSTKNTHFFGIGYIGGELLGYLGWFIRDSNIDQLHFVIKR